MATADEQIAEMTARANAVATLADMLRRAKRGEIRHVVIATENTGIDEHATVHSSLRRPGERLRLIGLLHMALDRLTKAW